KELEGLWSQILFPDHSVLAYHERLHAGIAVLRRRGHQREAANHYAFDDVVQLAQRRRRPLSLQHFEEIAVVGLLTLRVALSNCRRDFLADWSIPGAIGVLPGQAILLPFGADDSLGILVHAVDFLRDRILILRLDVTVTDFNRVQLVLTYAAHENFAP